MSHTSDPHKQPRPSGDDTPVRRTGSSLPAVEQAKACTPCADAAAGASLLFAVLHHSGHGPAHWDFLLQIPGREKLLTWRLALPPEKWPAASPADLAATRLDDHRPIYLTYQGRISGNRGHVQRVASGTAALLEQTPATLRLRLADPVACELSLPCQAGESPSPDNGGSPMDLNRLIESAYEQALAGYREGGLPIGSVLAADTGAILAAGHNLRVQSGDPTAHAEVVCIRNAGRRRDWPKLTLISTLSPCIMCTGTALLYRIGRIIIGENQNFRGAEDLFQLHGVELVNLHHPPCIELMQQFIREKPDLWNEDIGLPI